MMSKYMQVVWLYVIGLAVIFIGILMISSSTSSAFMVMLVGLGIATIGSAHGRKMREEAGVEDFFSPGRGRDASHDDEKRKDKEIGAKDESSGHVHDSDEEVSEDIHSGSVEEGDDSDEAGLNAVKGGAGGVSKGVLPEKADIVELVCPVCSVENDSRSFYCWSCGSKLRKKPVKSGKTAEKIAFSPENIEIIGGRKIAKVVICPKCSSSNKEEDKYCWNCGKKLRSSHHKKS